MTGSEHTPLSEEEATQAARDLFTSVAWQHDALLALHDDNALEPGSELRADDEDSHPYKVSHTARFAMAAAVEHLQAVEAILFGAGVLFPSAQYTLIRAAIETASTAVWVLAPDERAKRVLRSLQAAVDNAAMQDALVRGIGQTPQKSLEEHRAKINSLPARCRCVDRRIR